MGVYNIMFYGGLILAILFLIVTVAIFFLMKIPRALGVLTGKTQKKAIEEIKSGGAKGGKRGRGSRILARDIGGDSGTLTGASGKVYGASGKVYNKPSSTSASDLLAKKAAEDARIDTARAEAAKPKQNRPDLDEDSTEILTYNEMKKKAEESEDPTSVLKPAYDDEATDVLAAEGEQAGSDEEDVAYEPGADDVTDVLTSDGKAPQRQAPKKEAPSKADVEEDKTDVLKMGSSENTIDDFDDEEDEELDKTDVLVNQNLSESDVYGTYNPETTSVLRADMATEQTKKTSHPNRDGIKVLYSETIVHTEESL